MVKTEMAKLHSCFNCIKVNNCIHINKKDLSTRQLNIRLCKNYKEV